MFNLSYFFTIQKDVFCIKRKLFYFFQFLTARPTKMISDKRHAAPDSSFIMYHPSKIVLRLYYSNLFTINLLLFFLFCLCLFPVFVFHFYCIMECFMFKIFFFVAVLPIIVNLLLNAHTKEEHREQVDELTLVFLSDLTILLNSNLDNKR